MAIPIDATRDGSTESEQTDDRHQRSRSRAAGSYLFAVVAGVIPVFVSPSLWMLPVIAMVAYLISGYSRAKTAGAVYEFADSFYYLGFTLSVGSLLAALDPFDLVASPDPNKIFHLFGLGMLTTLIGVVGRTALQTFHRDTSENIEAVNARIVREADNYLVQLSTLSRRVQAVLVNTAQGHEDVILPHLARVQKTVQETAEQLENTAKHTQTLNDEIQRASKTIATFADSCGRASDGFDETNRKLAGAHGGLVEQLNTTMSAVANANRALADSLGKVTQSAGTCQNALDAMARRVSSVDTSSAQHSLDRVAETVGVVTERVRGAVQGLAEDTDQLSVAVAEANKAGGALRTKALAVSLERMSGEVGALADGVGRYHVGIDTHLAGVSKTAAQTLETARRLNLAMDEVVDAATAKLYRLP